MRYTIAILLGVSFTTAHTLVDRAPFVNDQKTLLTRDYLHATSTTQAPLERRGCFGCTKKPKSTDLPVLTPPTVSRKPPSSTSGPPGETSEERVIRLAKMTPTSLTLQRMRGRRPHHSLPIAEAPTAAQMKIKGGNTKATYRTHAAHEKDVDWLPPNQRYFKKVTHDFGSTAMGESKSDEGKITGLVQGRRVETAVVTEKGAQARIDYDLDGRQLHGFVGSGVKAKIGFRHPDPNGRFIMGARLVGKGKLNVQGQGHAGSKDRSPNDIAYMALRDRIVHLNDPLEGPSSPASSSVMTKE